MKSAARVGGLLVVFVGLFVAFGVLFGSRLFKAAPKAYYATFADAGGVAQGSRVLLAGVQVGTVTGVGLRDARTARVTLAIDRDVPVLTGTVVQVPTALVGLGETSLLLVPPTGEAVPLPPGSTLRGVKPGPLDSFLPNAEDTVAALTDVLKEVKNLLADDKIKGNATKVLENLAKTLERVEKITARSDGLLAKAEPELLATLRAGRGTVGNVEKTTANLARLSSDPQLERNVKQLAAQLVTLSKRADSLVASLDRSVNDPALRGPLARSAASAERIAAQGEKIAANVNDLTESAKISAKNAETITANLAKASEKAVPIAEKVEALAEGAKGIEERFDNLLRRFGGRRAGEPAPAGSGFALPSVAFQADLLRENAPNRLRADVNADFTLGQRAFTAGVFDAFGNPRLNAQLVQELGAGKLRYGLFAGQPALGVDWPLARNVTLRNDVWDLNAPRYDARLRIGLGSGLVGWIGVDRIFERNAFTIGLGVRR